MSLRNCSILLLKEPPTPIDPIPSHQTLPDDTPPHADDPYSDALHAAFSQHLSDVRLKVEYLPPMTTVFPVTTLLSRAIADGYPPVQPQSRNTEFGNLWAFAVTSQNAVHAVEAALQQQLDPAIRKAWLQIPIYCLTGATLAAVKKAGFTTINPLSSPNSDDFSTLPTHSFDNAAQLADVLISLKWPSIDPVQGDSRFTRHNLVSVSPDPAASSSDFFSPPELWFLTGETRMKTLAEKMTAHQRPFREVVVYETGPRPAFEEELSQWLAVALEEYSQTNAPVPTTPKIDTDKPTDLWLVGFSPKGVDLTMPILKTSLESSLSSSSSALVRIQWGAIGPTTASRIQEHLLTTVISTPRVAISFTVAVAKSPKPLPLAEAITSHSSGQNNEIPRLFKFATREYK
ncbi:MAG: hypothetical protein J3R72DRAFT_431530 [Linnemannia gamsii]|nr:MAG: hypothetical protein J3R72DRAFT_431530 [Linnemannia gamsii]